MWATLSLLLAAGNIDICREPNCVSTSEGVKRQETHKDTWAQRSSEPSWGYGARRIRYLHMVVLS